jgi:hypothetical protein
VPYLKFSRDKRGYENFYLIEPPSGGREQRGKARPRVLFWFRTPPSVKVGRVPFSDDVRKLIEAQNPELRFDWPRIMSTPIPPPDADHWRERRRVEKAARRAAREAEAAAEAHVAVDEAEAQPVAVAEESTSEPEDVAAIEEAIVGSSVETVDTDVPSVDDQAVLTSPASDSQAEPPHPGRRRRRRRRGRRGRHGAAGAAQQSGSEAPEEMTPAQQDAATESETPPSDEV